MPGIEQPPLQKEPLNEDEAHETANMVKVEAGVDPVFGQYQKPKTAEEYDNALAVVEEIKRMAEKEPLTQKVLQNISRLAIKSGYGVLEVIGALSAPQAGAAEMMYQKRIAVLDKIADASTRLKELKAKAKDYGKFETKGTYDK